MLFRGCTCHAGYVDNASSRPPQQGEEHLTHLHSTQEVHIHEASPHCDWLELCVHGTLKDSCIIDQTPQACSSTTQWESSYTDRRRCVFSRLWHVCLTCGSHLRTDVVVYCFYLGAVSHIKWQDLQVLICSFSQLLSSNTVHIQHASKHHHSHITETLCQLVPKSWITSLEKRQTVSPATTMKHVSIFLNAKVQLWNSFGPQEPEVEPPLRPLNLSRHPLEQLTSLDVLSLMHALCHLRYGTD